MTPFVYCIFLDRNRLFHAEEGSAINQDDDDDKGEQYDSDDDEAASFMKT